MAFWLKRGEVGIDEGGACPTGLGRGNMLWGLVGIDEIETCPTGLGWGSEFMASVLASALASASLGESSKANCPVGEVT